MTSWCVTEKWIKTYSDMRITLVNVEADHLLLKEMVEWPKADLSSMCGKRNILNCADTSAGKETYCIDPCAGKEFMARIHVREQGILMNVLTRRLEKKWSRGTAHKPWIRSNSLFLLKGNTALPSPPYNGCVSTFVWSGKPPCEFWNNCDILQSFKI